MAQKLEIMSQIKFIELNYLTGQLGLGIETGTFISVFYLLTNAVEVGIRK